MHTPIRLVVIIGFLSALGCTGPDDTGPLLDSDTDSDQPAAPELRFSLMPQGIVTKAGIGVSVYVDFLDASEAPASVEFSAEPALEGLSLTPSSDEPRNGDAELMLEVTADTPVGEHVLTLTANAPGFSPGSADLSVEVIAP